jgi:hypothetical protein
VATPLTASPTLDHWRQGIQDPAAFARLCLGVELHEGQRKWLTNATRRENVLVTGNRWGKSFATAVRLIHHAVYRLRPLRYDSCGRYRAAVASITQDQANIVFHQVIRLIHQSPCLLPLVESITWTPYPRLTLENGATIEARTTQNRGEHLLGNDYDLFIFDEVAFETCPEYVVEEVILMRLADREGILDLVSTPNGKNWFYQRARDISEGCRRGYCQSGDSRENPYISEEYLEDRVRYFSDTRLRQNIMGQFVDSGGEVIPGAQIDSALNRYAQTRPRTCSRFYLSGWDLARKQTATVGITVEMQDSLVRIVKLERFRQAEWVTVIEHIKQRQLEFPGRLVVDGTGLGDVVVEQLREFNPEAVVFTEAVKATLLANVELFHARGQIAYPRYELPDGPGRVWSLEDELRAARWDDNNRCDALMALALALWPLRKRSAPAILPRVGIV